MGELIAYVIVDRSLKFTGDCSQGLHIPSLCCSYLSQSHEAMATQLHDAARSGNVDKVRKILRSGEYKVDCTDYGETPLHYACSEGHLDTVRVLISEFNADVHCADSDGETPLHHACRWGT
jgi:ankyrin repeat protein